jgi:hypothetical protein
LVSARRERSLVVAFFEHAQLSLFIGVRALAQADDGFNSENFDHTHHALPMQ